MKIWYRPNINTVSIGNLVLHLCGNVRQWLISGLGGAEDHRERQKEFDEKGPLPTIELIEMIDQLATEIEVVLQGLAPSDLITERTIQGYPSTGVFHSGSCGRAFFIPCRSSNDSGEITKKHGYGVLCRQGLG